MPTRLEHNLRIWSSQQERTSPCHAYPTADEGTHERLHAHTPLKSHLTNRRQGTVQCQQKKRGTAQFPKSSSTRSHTSCILCRAGQFRKSGACFPSTDGKRTTHKSPMSIPKRSSSALTSPSGAGTSLADDNPTGASIPAGTAGAKSNSLLFFTFTSGIGLGATG